MELLVPTYGVVEASTLTKQAMSEQDFVGRVIGAASQGAVGAVVAASLSAVTEPLVNSMLVKRTPLLEALKELDPVKVQNFLKTTLATNFIKFPFFEATNIIMQGVDLPPTARGAALGSVFAPSLFQSPTTASANPWTCLWRPGICTRHMVQRFFETSSMALLATKSQHFSLVWIRLLPAPWWAEWWTCLPQLWLHVFCLHLAMNFAATACSLQIASNPWLTSSSLPSSFEAHQLVLSSWASVWRLEQWQHHRWRRLSASWRTTSRRTHWAMSSSFSSPSSRSLPCDVKVNLLNPWRRRSESQARL